nr:hypothetical protein [Paenibacillus dendritiformis]
MKSGRRSPIWKSVPSIKTGNLLEDPAVKAVIQEEKKHRQPQM